MRETKNHSLKHFFSMNQSYYLFTFFSDTRLITLSLEDRYEGHIVLLLTEVALITVIRVDKGLVCVCACVQGEGGGGVNRIHTGFSQENLISNNHTLST